MAHLRCDECGSSDTDAFGGWDTPIKILCKKCSNKKDRKQTNNKRTAMDLAACDDQEAPIVEINHPDYGIWT